ncbi:reverse transcriptase domain-containing protein [Tanacetum coccineum]
MLYGSECWPITKALANRMEVTELRMLRWTCGKTLLDMIPNGVYRAQLEVETIINKMREGRLRWFGHVRRRPQSAPVRRVKALVVDILRRRGRPKVRWEDRVKHDMKELLLSEDMISDRIEWRARIRCFLFMLACSFLLCLLPCLCACSVPSMLCVVAFAFCVPCFSCLLLVSVLVCFRVLFKGGAIVYTCWIEKMESVQDISECGDGQKVNYTAGSFVDFMTLMRVEFCPNNEMQKLETEFWNHAIVGVGHAAYTDRFHKLARLVPHQVTPENKRIERYIYGLASQIRGMVAATKPTIIQKAMQKASTPTDEAIRNGSLKRNPERRGNGEEPSRDRNVKDDNKRTRIGNDFATTANPVRREYVGAAPKAVPKMVNPVNARNPTAAHGACFECGGTDHFKAACPRLNQAHRPGGNCPNQAMANNWGQGRENNSNQARGRAFMLGAYEARQDPNIVTGTFTLNNHYATTLFDSGANYIFVSTTFIPLLGIEPSDLGFSYEIEITSGS